MKSLFANKDERRIVGAGVSVYTNQVCNPRAKEMEETNRLIPFAVVKTVEDFIRAGNFRGRVFKDSIRAKMYHNFGYRWFREQDFYTDENGVCLCHLD